LKKLRFFLKHVLFELCLCNLFRCHAAISIEQKKILEEYEKEWNVVLIAYQRPYQYIEEDDMASSYDTY